MLKTNMIIEIEKLPSGFYMVSVNGCWIDASITSREAARKRAADLVAIENSRQNRANSFSNIPIIER